MTVRDDKTDGQTDNRTSAYTDPISAAIGNALNFTSETAATIASMTEQFKANTTTMTETATMVAHRMVEQGTETVGRIVTPIAENPIVQSATQVPGLKWLMAALGQVNVAQVQQEVAQLKADFPLETPEQLANRIINETALQGAQVGLLTNLAPPLALSLLAVDLTAIAALQAKMIYRIAAVYGLPLHEPTRRGEILAIWGLSSGGSTVIKAGLSVVEVLPGIGTVTGAVGNATLLYSLGQIARQFYENKRRAAQSDNLPEDFIDSDRVL